MIYSTFCFPGTDLHSKHLRGMGGTVLSKLQVLPGSLFTLYTYLKSVLVATHIHKARKKFNQPKFALGKEMMISIANQQTK